MKKFIATILCSAAALASLVSCDITSLESSILDQNSPSTFDAAVVYSNYALAEGCVFGIVESFCEVNSYRGRFLPWYGYNTDIEWYNGFGSSSKQMDNKNEICSYGITSNNTQLNTNNNPYVLMYTGIERANLVIEGLEKYADLADKDLAHLLAEAKTLRAMIYYDLIKAWGDVPARFESLTSDNIYVKKENRDVIFKHILADLEEAIPALYYPGESEITAKTDRINKAFAEGLYARIALAASGYALRPDDGKVGTGNAGSVRLSSDAELQKSVLYPKALAYLQDVISCGKCSLYPSYETLWRNFNSFDLEAGKEVLYVIPFGDGRGRWNYTFAIKNEGGTINGYSYSQGGQGGPVPSFFFDFADNDTRRDLTCVNYKWNKTSELEPAGIANWYFGKYRFEWMDKNPYTGGNDDGAKPVVMRYSDILLMASEIANELGDLGKAKEYFLPVRARACGEEAAEQYVAAISSKDAMFSKIVDERAFEFCGEFLRKGDLIRWNMLKTKLDEAKAHMLDLRDMKGSYSYLTGDIYFQVGEDEESLVIYGLKKGEQAKPAGDWELSASYFKYDDAKKTGLFQLKIDNMYINDPNTYMYWPIFDDTISNSQGNLVNDYAFAI